MVVAAKLSGKMGGRSGGRRLRQFLEPLAISRVPLRVFQGEMMKQLKKVQANLRHSEYHKMDHSVWDKAFAEPELIPRLASQRRAQTVPSQVGSGATPKDQ